MREDSDLGKQYESATACLCEFSSGCCFENLLKLALTLHDLKSVLSGMPFNCCYSSWRYAPTWNLPAGILTIMS
eukprot:scaffold15546_cov66-Skeletonema_marinoi.AAC.2